MEFDFNQFKIVSQLPYLKLDRNNAQLFKISENKNPKKVFTLMVMDGTNQFHAEQLRIHLQSQSFTKGVVCVKGFKQMDSQDTFGFKVERTGWLVQEIENTLSNICINQRQNISNQPIGSKRPSNLEQIFSQQLIQKLLKEASETLAELQSEDISLGSLSLQSFVLTQTQNLKILDISSAINVVGMESSITRQIQGNPLYYDPETHRASLLGEAFASQNYYKSSVYSLGLVVLEVGLIKPLERRQTSSEIDYQLTQFRNQFGRNLADILTHMLAPDRANRPDCLQLKLIIDNDNSRMMNQPPLLLLMQSDNKEEDASLALTDSFMISNVTKMQTKNTQKFQDSIVEFREQFTESKNQVRNIIQDQGFQFDNNSAIQMTNSQYMTPIPAQLYNQQAISQAEFQFGESQMDGQSQGDQLNKINTVKLSESLRKKIKQYQLVRNKDKEDEQIQQFGQGQGTSRSNYDDESESSDYIEEPSNLLISLQQLDKALKTVGCCLPSIEVAQIKIEKYNFILKRTKMLGRGTEGVVYQCSLDKCHNLAVKVLLDIDNSTALDIILTTSSVQSKGFKGIFSYDYYAIEPSKSKNAKTILGFLGVDDTNCNLYMVSRRMRCDLGYANRELDMSDKEKMFICTQIAQVLDKLENIIIHGDMKPSNILLDAEFNISVIDFGMSRILSKSHNHLVRSTSHTYLYSPPEQVNHEQVHLKSDIWSFGIIIFELFTKKQISLELIVEMGMYDDNRRGSLKFINPEGYIYHQQLYTLIEQMTQYDYELRLSPKQILKEIQKIENNIFHHQKPKNQPPQFPFSPSGFEQLKASNKQKIKQAINQKRSVNISSNQLVILGKQVKYFTPDTRNPNQDTSQTQINKKESRQQQQYPTQVTKK